MNLKLMAALYGLLLVFAGIQVVGLQSGGQLSTLEAPSMSDTKIVVVTAGLQYDIAQYSWLFRFLRSFSVSNVSGISSYRDLQEADVIVLLGPTSITDAVADYIDMFLREGGSLLLALPTNKSLVENLEPLLDVVGVNVLGPALNNVSYFRENSSLLLNSSDLLTSHPIMSSRYGIVREIVVPHPVALEVRNASGVSASGVRNVTRVMWGPNGTFVDDDYDGVLEEDELLGQNATLAITIETWWGGRILVLPTCEMIKDDILSNTTAYDNLMFLLNAIYWISKQIAYLDVRPLNSPPREIIFKETKSFTLTIMLLNEANNTVGDAKVLGVISLLKGTVLIAAGHYNSSRGVYEITFNLTNLPRTGVYDVYVVAYKEFSGYSWAYLGNFTASEVKYRSALASYAIFVIGFIAPLVASIAYLLVITPHVRKLRSLVKSTEEKIKASGAKR